jgi:methionine synthase II (cobalamin-independent)
MKSGRAYDIHSPNVPSVEWIEALLKKPRSVFRQSGCG